MDSATNSTTRGAFEFQSQTYLMCPRFYIPKRGSQKTQATASGKYSDKDGYYIRPTVVLTSGLYNKLVKEDILVSVPTVYVNDGTEFG
ncbi:hypothetical protein GGI09_001280 [Coemansia sp. S100]|nr:hypothetical protein GGI09_001280 [Coemansia sp. S100]